jgi:hypothetical protein
MAATVWAPARRVVGGADGPGSSARTTRTIGQVVAVADAGNRRAG